MGILDSFMAFRYQHWKSRKAGLFDAAVIPHLPKKKYIKSIIMAPPHAREMYAKCWPISFADFTHRKARESCTSVIGTRSILTANRQIEVLVVGIFMSNENRETWDTLNEFTGRHVPEFKQKGSVDITDANVNARLSGRALNGENQGFQDFHHMTTQGGPVWNLGPEALTAFIKLFNAGFNGHNWEHFDQAMSELPPRLKAWMASGNYDPKELFPFAAGLGMTQHGSPAESINISACHTTLRECPGAAFLVEAPKGIIKMSLSHRAEAHEWNPANKTVLDTSACSAYPKSLWPHYRTEQLAADSTTVTYILVTPDNSQCYMEIPGIGSVTITYSAIASINPGKACSLGCCAASGVPCRHVWLAVKQRGGRGMQDFLDPRDTTAGWEDQYAALSLDSIPNLMAL